jgi:hypothetical protein
VAGVFALLFFLVGLKLACIPNVSFLGCLEIDMLVLGLPLFEGGGRGWCKGGQVTGQFHISSSRVAICLHTKFHLPGVRLPDFDLTLFFICWGGGR